MISTVLNEPVNYERMLEVSTEQLEYMKQECDLIIQELKRAIIQEYEIIKPSLMKMRDMKQQLVEVREKREAYKLFLSIDKNQSIISSTTSTDRKPVSLSDLFHDIDNNQLVDDPTPPQTLHRREPHARPSTPVRQSKIPVRRSSIDEKPQSLPNLLSPRKK